MTTKTFRLSGLAIERQWHVVDAAGRPLGRVATEAAQLLLGKHKPTYEPHLAMGDHVIVVNAARVELTGAKREQKVYYRHTGYPGGLRERSFEEQMQRDPRRVIERAVKGMLPHNARGRQLFRMLKVYAGPDHPHEAQVNAGTGARAQKAQRRAEQQPTRAAAPAAPPSVEQAPPPSAETPPAAEQAQPDATEAAVEASLPHGTEQVSPPAAEETPPAAEQARPDAAEAAVEASLPHDGESEAALRLSGSLQRYRREELDAEAERLGITIESGWNKPDVAEAIQKHYDANPVEGEE